MNKPYQLLLALGIGAASLSSCSRANYAVNTTTPTSESVQIAAPASDAAASATATVSATMPTEAVAPAREAAAALAHHAAPAQAEAKTVKTAAVDAAAPAQATAPKVAVTKAERKSVRVFVKKAMLAPQNAKAEGKSQLTALLLAIFLGTLGVARFYLGYSGRGILMLVLTLLIIPAIVSFVLNILDIIKIAGDDLKPASGDYTKKM